MSVPILCEADLETLRAVVRCRFDRDETMRLCSSAGWVLLDEILESKLLQYQATFDDGKSERVVTIHREDDMMKPCICVPLRLFRGDSDWDQEEFDEVFRAAEDGLSSLLGSPHASGVYDSVSRVEGALRYVWWRLTDAAVSLVQNQFDPGSDLDVSLWMFPPSEELLFPITNN